MNQTLAASPSTLWLVRPIVLAIALSVLSGMGDAYGFVHASRIWRRELVVWGEMGRSALGFSVGTALQWLAIRYLRQVGVTIAEVQTLVLFAATMIGIALLNRSFFAWASADRAVAALVVFGLAWLIVRTGA
jgi:hypothetical protein